MTTHILRITGKDRHIFDAIRSGEKKVETRAASPRNQLIQKGDTLEFICGSHKFKKKIVKAKIYRSIGAMLKDYKVNQIAPELKTESELRDMYHRWTAYREKIKQYGLIVLELK